MKNNLNEKIINNVKQKISISNFIEEEQKDMKKGSIKIFKSACIAICMIFCVTGVVFAKDISNFINKIFGDGASDGVHIATENNYYQEVDSDYIESDGISIALDSFLIDDYNFDMNFKIKLSEKYNTKDFEFGLGLYDLKIVNENGEKVFATYEIEAEEMKSLYKTEEEKQNYDGFTGAYSGGAEYIDEGNLMYHLNATAFNFPKSQKLFVTFSRIHLRKDRYEQPLDVFYTGNWNFEVNVPEEMYKEDLVIYKVKKCNDKNTKVDDYGFLSNTAFKMSISESTTDKVDYDKLSHYDNISIFNMIAFQKEYIETSDKKKFEPAHRSDGDGGYAFDGEKTISNYYQTFNLTKFDATDKLTVHIFTNKGEEIIIEYERIK